MDIAKNCIKHIQISMNWNSVSFDWNQARAFLATAEEGSFSAGARALNLTQPTLSRQVAGLEENLNVLLFERVGRSLTLTKSGLELLEHFKAMGDAANKISLAASGQFQSIEGLIVIAATDLMAAFYLPPLLKKIQKKAPQLEIELVISNDIRDLTRREADISIRHVRPDQPSLIAKRMSEKMAHIFAASTYLDQIGRPITLRRINEAAFIGIGNVDEALVGYKKFGLDLDAGNFKLVANSGSVVWELVKQGLGISMMPKEFCEHEGGVEMVLPEAEGLNFPVWLVTHRELHTSRRIRLVFDMLAEGLS